jgi:hypothetical protein
MRVKHAALSRRRGASMPLLAGRVPAVGELSGPRPKAVAAKQARAEPPDLRLHRRCGVGLVRRDPARRGYQATRGLQPWHRRLPVESPGTGGNRRQTAANGVIRGGPTLFPTNLLALDSDRIGALQRTVERCPNAAGATATQGV